MTTTPKTCSNNTPSWFVGHWRDWHRGHGCEKDDGKPRSDDATTEIAQHAQSAATGFLTDAEVRFLRASTTSGNELLVRALDELTARRAWPHRGFPVPAVHCMMGPPGHRCSCGTSFDDYDPLAEHVRQSIDCPRCGGTPADLGDGDLHRWRCGHWVARGDFSAALRDRDDPLDHYPTYGPEGHVACKCGHTQPVGDDFNAALKLVCEHVSGSASAPSVIQAANDLATELRSARLTKES